MKNAIDPAQFKKFIFRSVTIPLIVSICLSGVFVFLITHLMSVNQWVDHSNRVVAKSHEILQLMVDAETGVRGFALTKDETFLEPYEEAIKSYQPKFQELSNLTSDNAQQNIRVSEIRNAFREWREFGEKVVEVKRSGADPEKLITSLEGKRIMDIIRERFARFIQTEEALRNERSQTTLATVKLALSAVLLGSLIAGLFLAFYTRKQLMVLSTIYDNTLRKQHEQNQILEAQEWLQTGQAELMYEVRGDLNLEVISSNILSYLVKRTGAQVGALHNLAQGQLKRISTYALDAVAESKKPLVKLGEGLVGQAAVENEPQVVSVPEGYMDVSSGVGGSKSQHLVIFPVSADGQVKAVVELGFLGEVPERAMDFLKLVSESTAISIKSAEYRALLASLLEEAQRQTEELQAQQEELRANNEELEEQTNALKVTQIKLETQQSELEQTNNQLSKQSAELEVQAEAIKGKNEELSRAQVVLEEKAKELELSSQYKSQFLSNMSHELRTPLNSTLILAQLLVENKRGRLGSEEVEFARTILSSSNNLLTLINDILDLSKVEAGKIDLISENLLIEEVMGDLDRMFTPIANNKGIEFKLELDPLLPQNIVTDRQRLEQILKNLLSNALKFTSKGSVTLRVAPSPEVPDAIDFSVIDTGIGISQDQQNVIFDAFKQADGTTSRMYGGTGLGLTISRDLARLLGGSIHVKSTQGKGSVFTLTLGKNMDLQKVNPQRLLDDRRPTPVVAPKVEAASPEKILRIPLPFEDDREKLNENYRILLVIEDDASFAHILYKLSQELSFNCIVAQTADEGIEVAQEFLPHAIILDLHLPDHNGLTVLDRLKMNAKTRHIPVHIISAQDESRLALQMGAIGFLQKPVNLDAVKSVIAKMEEKLEQGMKKVLVVEDNKVQRDSIRELIQDSKVEVKGVESAAEAMKLLETEIFDCMILDLHLPDMSGYSLLEKMTTSQLASRPPVIVHTGTDLSRAEEEKLHKYSQSIIVKGAHSPERLLSEVTLFLHQVETNLSKDRQLILQELRNREKIFENKKILLVDDDVRNIFALSSALEGKGASVETARNGLEAVRKVKDDPSIDLVLMDIMMPEMDGYQAMREIRRESRFAKLPIIALTAKAMADDQEKCRQAGANDYLAKPVDLQKLLSLLRVWMPQGRKA